MIIGSSTEWPIGSRQVGVNQYDDAPFLVLCHATKEDWVAQHVERTGRPFSPLTLHVMKEVGIVYFYEISVD